MPAGNLPTHNLSYVKCNIESFIMQTTDLPINIMDFYAANLYFSWSQQGVGFGQFHISLNKDGSITADTECMGREALRRALHAAVDTLVDKAEIR